MRPQAQPRRRRARRTRGQGFTLLELIVVMLIIGLIAGLSIRGLRSLAKSDLRTSAAKLSGAMRYLFDRASTTGKYHRLVIDVDEGRYWAEVSDDRFFLPREPETEEELAKKAKAEAKQDEEDERRAEMASAASDVDMSKLEPQDFRPQRVRFGAFKETALKPVTMSKTKVVDVFVPRVAELVTHGRAYIYFFPLGQTEPAIVHLSDPEGETEYSLVVHPITGQVRIYNEYIQPPAEAVTDDQGNVVQ